MTMSEDESLKDTTKVLELIGVTVLEDSLKCVKDNGILCITGIAGGKVSDSAPRLWWPI